MKKSIILLIISIVAFCCPVQAEHLKFMGIPLTGTINQFQQKLAAKGVTYNKAASESSPKGVRCFKGTFAGSESYIFVWYNIDTKIVYGAKAMFECLSETSGKQMYEDLKSMLSIKYAEEYSQIKEINNLEAFEISVTDDGNQYLGEITLFNQKGEYPYEYKRFIQVEYLDAENYGKNEYSKMNDL